MSFFVLCCLYSVIHARNWYGVAIAAALCSYLCWKMFNVRKNYVSIDGDGVLILGEQTEKFAWTDVREIRVHDTYVDIVHGKGRSRITTSYKRFDDIVRLLIDNAPEWVDVQYVDDGKSP